MHLKLINRAILLGALCLNAFPLTAQVTRKEILDSQLPGYETSSGPAMVVTNDGVIVIFRTLRTVREDGHNTDLGYIRSIDGGTSFEPLKIFYGEPDDVYDSRINHEMEFLVPSLIQDPDTERIHLWFTGRGSVESSGRFSLLYAYSDDNGQTFTNPVIDDSWLPRPYISTFFTTFPHGIALSNGQYYFAVWYRPSEDFPKHTRVGGFTTEGSGNERIWKWAGSVPAPADGFGTNPFTGTAINSNIQESSVVEIAPGEILMVSRHNQMPYKLISRSYDYGITWEEATVSSELRTADWGPNGEHDRGSKTGLLAWGHDENGVAQRVAYVFPDGQHPIPNDRINGTIWISYDRGYSWPTRYRFGNESHFGYTDMALLNDNTVIVVADGARSLEYFTIRIPEIETHQRNSLDLSPLPNRLELVADLPYPSRYTIQTLNSLFEPQMDLDTATGGTPSEPIRWASTLEFNPISAHFHRFIVE